MTPIYERVNPIASTLGYLTMAGDVTGFDGVNFFGACLNGKEGQDTRASADVENDLAK